MKIQARFRVRKVADQSIILLFGETKNQVLELNGSSLYLWETLQGKDFEEPEVTGLLTARYEVSHAQAQADAEKWIAKLKELGIITV